MADIIKAVNEGTDSNGGFAVPEEFAARVLELIQANTVTLPDLEQVRMNTDTWNIPKVTTGTTAYLVPELGTITASQPGFGRTTLTPKKFAALVESSTEWLEDNNIAGMNLLMQQMGKDVALKIDSEVLNGTGGDGFVGLRNTGSFTNSVAAGAPTTSGTSAGNIGLTAISKAVDEILKDNQQMPDIGYFHARTLGSLRLLTDSSGRPIFNQETWGSPLLREGVVGTVYGIKTKPANQLPINVSVGTASGEPTTTDVIIGKSGQFGFYGMRRDVTARRDYTIASDREVFQITTRSAFGVKYPDAYCVIRSVKD